MPKLISRDDIVSDEELPITVTTPTPPIATTPETPASGSSTANDFFNTNNSTMALNITTENMLASSATTWTAQEKIWFKSLSDIGVNLFEEANNVFGNLIKELRQGGGKIPISVFYTSNGTNYNMNAGDFTLNWLKNYVESKGTTLSAFLQNAMQRNGIAVAQPSTPSPSVPVSNPSPSNPTPNPLNPTISTKPEIQQKLIAIADSYDLRKWHMATTMQNFVKDDANLQAMKDAVAILGYPIFDTGRGWEWATQDWICLARYFKNFPIPTAENTNCSTCNAAITLLSAEDAAIVNETTLGGNQAEAQSKQKALNQVKSLYNAWFVKNDCAKKLVEEQADKQQSIQEKQSEQSNQQVLDALKIAGQDVSKTSNITTYAIYGFGGLILISGVVFLFRK
jgi:hypothetical protein